jgi:hypothetical protein
MQLPDNITSADIQIMADGMRAARAWKSRTDCPHLEGSRAAQCWIAGWAHAQPGHALRKAA